VLDDFVESLIKILNKEGRRCVTIACKKDVDIRSCAYLVGKNDGLEYAIRKMREKLGGVKHSEPSIDDHELTEADFEAYRAQAKECCPKCGTHSSAPMGKVGAKTTRKKCGRYRRTFYG
jgi:hypothetical protein